MAFNSKYHGEEVEQILDSVQDKADIFSPEFSGTPKAPTAPTGTNTTQLASTQFVQQEIDRRSNQFSFTVGAGEFVLAKVESITSIL